MTLQKPVTPAELPPISKAVVSGVDHLRNTINRLPDMERSVYKAAGDARDSVAAFGGNVRDGVAAFGHNTAEKLNANKLKIAGVIGGVALLGAGMFIGKNYLADRNVPKTTVMEYPSPTPEANGLPKIIYDKQNDGSDSKVKTTRPLDQAGTDSIGDLTVKAEAGKDDTKIVTDWTATNAYFDSHPAEKSALAKLFTDKFGADGIKWLKENVDVVNPVMLDKDATKNDAVDEVFARAYVGETDKPIVRDTWGYDRKTGKIYAVDNQLIPQGHDMAFFRSDKIDQLPADHPLRKGLIEMKVKLADGRIVKGYEISDRWCSNPTTPAEKPEVTPTPTPHHHKKPTPTPTNQPSPTPTPFPPKVDNGTVPGPDNTHNIQPTKVPESATPDNGQQNPVGGPHEVAPTAAPTTAPEAPAQSQPTEAPSIPQPTQPPYDANQGNPNPTPGGKQEDVPMPQGYNIFELKNNLYAYADQSTGKIAYYYNATTKTSWSA